MRRNSVKLTTYEKEILRILLKRISWINTTQIAKLGKMNWNTAKKYLDLMYGRGWLHRKGNYWKARR